MNVVSIIVALIACMAWLLLTTFGSMIFLIELESRNVISEPYTIAGSLICCFVGMIWSLDVVGFFFKD